MKFSMIGKLTMAGILVAAAFTNTYAAEEANSLSNLDPVVASNAVATSDGRTPVEAVPQTDNTNTADTEEDWRMVDRRSQRISIDGGIAIPTGVNHFSDSEKLGPIVGLQYLYETDSQFSVGVGMDYFHFPAKTHLADIANGGQANVDDVDNATVVELIGRYNWFSHASIMPYFHGGIGGNYFHQTTNGTPNSVSVWPDTGTTETRQLQDVSTLGFACSVGLGLETDLTQNLVLGIEGAWNILGVSKSTYGTSTIGFPSAVVRLGWRFGIRAPQSES